MRRTILFLNLLLITALAACSSLASVVPGEEPTDTPIPATPENPASGDFGIGDPYFPELGNSGYDVQHYHIDLNVDMDTNEIDGSTTMQVRATQDLSAFSLDFIGLQVDQILINEEEASFERDEGKLVILLPEAMADGQLFTTTVSYHGTPGEDLDTEGLAEYEVGWGFYGTGVYVAGEPTGSSSWYPVNEHPLDKATYSFRITVDKLYQVAANGLLQDEIENDGQVTYVWESQHPQAPYLTTIAISEFDIQEQTGPNGLPIRNYFGVAVGNGVRNNFAKQPEMIEFFSEVFGPYPFEAYGVVVHDIGLGFALETQTLSVFGRSFTNEEVVSHEIAHQWYGNSVGLGSWQDIWLNEGFATYASLLWTEHTYGETVLEEQLSNMYSAMAPGQTIYDTSRINLARGLRDLIPAGESFDAENAEAALRLLLANELSNEELDAMAVEIPEEVLDRDGLIELLEAQPFNALDVSSSTLSDFFRQLNLIELSFEFAAFFPPPGDPGPESLFARSVYQRGALTLHALRLEVGDEAFFDILRTYADRYRDSNATTADFIAITEEISGQQLDSFFNGWLYELEMPDMPELGLYRADFVE